MENKVSKNIRCLRKAYGETQLELANIIHVSKQAISKYENGSIPDRDILIKIANHYLISVESLEKDDFIDNSGKEFVFEDLVEIFKKVLPIMKPDDSESDVYFKNAYELHLNIIDKICEMRQDALDDYEKCIDLYVESIDKTNSPKSAVNILWFLLMIGASFSINNNDTSMYTIKQFKKNKINHKEFMKTCYLGNEEFINGKSKQDLERKEFIKNIHEIVIECMCILRKSGNYFDLYEYYFALFYYTNCFDQNLSLQESRLIGDSMLETLLTFKNKYAINYFKIRNQYE